VFFFHKKVQYSCFSFVQKEAIEANFAAGFNESEVLAHDHQMSTPKRNNRAPRYGTQMSASAAPRKVVFMADISISFCFPQQKPFF
jgi:hypothetical protein